MLDNIQNVQIYCLYYTIIELNESNIHLASRLNERDMMIYLPEKVISPSLKAQ